MSRFERQERWFGADGQARLRATEVLVVGAGGLGSVVVQSLAYLGVGALSVSDPDAIEESNKNRVVGAWAKDPEGTPKVEVLGRLVGNIDPAIRFTGSERAIISEDSLDDLIASASWVFGCLDNDGGRLLLTERCAELGRPYVDIGTDIHVVGDQMVYGGRICISTDRPGCLHCFRQLDQEAIQANLADSAQRQDREAIYGVPASALGTSGPAVVSINGMLANLAVTEFLLELVGIREAIALLEYWGHAGKVFVDQTPPPPDCYYCGLKNKTSPA